jgi:LmbE family N-acetylglucosaminyl deacetylase
VRLFRDTPASVLAVYAHPDDADVAAGGALARWAREGARVDLIIACDGAKGSHDPSVDVALLRSRRAEELARAGEILGLQSVHCLGIEDGEVVNSSKFRAELVGAIRSHRPDVVVGPDPTAVFFGGVYVNHRDHRELGWALLDAVAPAAAMPLYFPERGAAHQVTTMLLSGTHEPDVVVDITTTIDEKVAAVLAHASQVSDDAEWVRSVVLGRAEPVGRDVNVRFGEAFRCVDIAR